MIHGLWKSYMPIFSKIQIFHHVCNSLLNLCNEYVQPRGFVRNYKVKLSANERNYSLLFQSLSLRYCKAWSQFPLTKDSFRGTGKVTLHFCLLRIRNRKLINSWQAEKHNIQRMVFQVSQPAWHRWGKVPGIVNACNQGLMKDSKPGSIHCHSEVKVSFVFFPASEQREGECVDAQHKCVQKVKSHPQVWLIWYIARVHHYSFAVLWQLSTALCSSVDQHHRSCKFILKKTEKR